jgi:hypothetical protein
MQTEITCSGCGYDNIFYQPYPYHSGFSNEGFLYNDAGNLTLTWSSYDPAFTALVGNKHPWTLGLDEKHKLESALSVAPDGDCWKFANPARWLGCGSPISGPVGDTIYYLLYEGSIQTRDLRTQFLLSASSQQNGDAP